MNAQQGGGNADNSMALLWAIAGIFVVALLIWHFFGYQLRVFFIDFRLAQTKFIEFFIHTDRLKALQDALQAVDPDVITLAQAKGLSTAVGKYLMWPVMALIGILIMLLLKGHMTMRFTRVHNMQTLLEQEQLNWPHVGIVTKLNLTDQDIAAGPWAMAMNPMQFCKKNKLIKVEVVPDAKAAWRAQGDYKVTVEKEKANRHFAMQLGPLFTHPMRMPKHTQALFAIFAARAAHDVDAARAMLNQLAVSSARGNINYTGVQKLMAKYLKDKAVERCMQRHAYVLTLMASMMELARTDGVLASAEFLWLKPVDRRLWYTLNCVGRQVVFAEVAGIFAHWRAEKELQRPLSVPLVDAATQALEQALAKMVYVPDEDEDLPKNG